MFSNFATKKTTTTLYAIIDVETTGGDSRRDKITEVAIILHDGQKISDRYCSLVNPGRPIPPMISRMIGITDQMVATAPKFYHIAREIVELTRDRVLVAHNASFDYYFLKNEFYQLGYEFRLPRICTVRFSRKAFPGLPSYNLDKLCYSLGITITDRHRALGDATATTKLFEMLLEEQHLRGIEPVVVGK